MQGRGSGWSWPPGTTAWTFNTWRRRRFTPWGEQPHHLPAGDVEGDNEQGLAVLCTYGDYDLLITGDRNMAAERQLIADHDLPDIEALVVGHHGSKSSTSKELLEALTPETGIISVGTTATATPRRTPSAAWCWQTWRSTGRTSRVPSIYL